MNVAQITKAITNIRPNSHFTQRGTDYLGLEWHDDIDTKPSESEWLSAIEQLNTVEFEKRSAAEAKLAALGLTAEDLKALGLA